MLSQLHIENVAVIERADLELDSGFNVLTGETGAGKSILIDSINFVLGERINKDIVRAGAASAHVTACFTDISPQILAQIEQLGFVCDEDGILLISRDLTAEGKGSCRISGRPATVSVLKEIGRMLVNIHGQHENQALLSPEKHLYYLDRYAGDEALFAEYTVSYRRMRKLEGELSSLVMDEAEKARRLDLLRYQIDEITAANPKPGEDEELAAQKLLIQNAEKISSAIGAAYQAISGGDNSSGAQELVSAAADELNGIVNYMPELEALAGRVASLSYELEDCVSELRGYLDAGNCSGDDIDYIEQRLDVLYRLKLKYGGSIEGVLLFLNDARKEIDTIESSEFNAQRLSEEFEKARVETASIAAALSKKRAEAAKSMEGKIHEELEFLEMPGVVFKVEISACADLTPNGSDNIEFLISANPGAPLRPLSKVVSGGELSRVMLGIKTVLADNDDIDTLIFDEIDTGVSGRAAQKIGMKLSEVSQSRQVICVTHLAQIAAQAERHTLIEKKIEAGKTYTILKTLDYSGRQHELARIIGGVDITELTLRNAAEMLENAKARTTGGKKN